MGFQIHEGNEIETEKYNFDLLNIPDDTTGINGILFGLIEKNVKGIYKNSTSPMQARIMEKKSSYKGYYGKCTDMSQLMRLMNGNSIK